MGACEHVSHLRDSRPNCQQKETQSQPLVLHRYCAYLVGPAREPLESRWREPLETAGAVYGSAQ